MAKTKGLKPKDRKLAATSKGKKGIVTANQWQNTPQQNKYMEAWLNPTSPTFGNAHKSALAAGYNPHYAMKIASPDTANKWIGEYRNIAKLELEHIEQKLIQMITGPLDSRSVDDTRVKAIEVYARVVGKLDNKNTTNVTLVQPILSGQSVHKPHIVEGEVIPPPSQ